MARKVSSGKRMVDSVLADLGQPLGISRQLLLVGQRWGNPKYVEKNTPCARL